MAHMSEEAYEHWQAYGYSPYNEEHWRYAQEQAQYEDWLSYAQYEDEWLAFMEAEH